VAVAIGISAILFLLFVANVVLGSTTGSPFLSDVAEMVLLFGGAVAFVAGILKRESDERKAKTFNESSQGGQDGS
jgi:hypothetical protein